VKYFARIEENEYEIEIDDKQILLDGQPIFIDFEQIAQPDLYSLLFGGYSHELLIESERFNYAVTLRGEQFNVQVEDERTRKLNAGRKPTALPDGEFALKAPIPGLVVKMLVDDGDEVEDGQSLVILEAMKMENELRSPKAGVVKKVEVVPGQRVEQNAILIVLE
jgi:biotin carboxyl carrier protein